MDLEDNLLILMNRNQEVGLYDTLKKLTQKYADKISICDKRIEKKIFYGSYEILLKKVNINFTAIPVDFTDEDIINALYLHFGKYINDETVKKLLSKFEILYKAQHTEIFQNWVGPMVKMLYSISINQSDNLKRKNSRNKQDKVWFDVDFIPRSLQNLKNYLPQTEMKFFKFPKIYSSQSEDNLAIYRPAQLPPSLIFNSIFKERNIRLRQQNMSCELDEGFVTPSEEHKEKSPYSENRTTFQASANKKFNWDFKVVCVPPSKYKTWEKFDLLGRKPEHPFLPKKINYQYWLSKAPHCFKKVSKSQLLDDMMSLLIGIPSTSFNYNGESFSLASGLYTDDHTMEEVMQMTKPYIEAAEAFIALKKLSENTSHGDTIMCAFKIALEQYLYKYQLMIFHLFNINNNNESYPSDVGLLMEQIIHLRLLLIHPEELKGITLLKRLYDNMVNTSTQKFYLLSYLFLLPCVYYFRLIDDWIFLGRWHKDLPITPCDITLVQDRKSWEEVYKPIQTDTPWFIPVPDLAHCGKALLLLSTSKRNEKFLSMLKSDDRPRIKLCIQSHQLKELESECYIYYKKAKNTFHTEEHKELDLAFCAEKSAKMRAQAFEELKKGKKECELERKKIELNLREEDLIRSANVKQALKREEELDNMRVAAQVEEIRFKEALLELDRAKKVYATLQQEHEKAEKSDLVAERKLKREQNNEKIQECLDNKIMLKESLPDEAEDLKLGIMENLVRLENKNHVKVSPTADKSHYLDGQKGEDNKIPRGYLCNEEPLELNVDCHESKYSELTRNRLKVLSSNLGVGEQMAPCLSEEISNKNEINCSQCKFPETTEKAPDNIVEQPSALAGYLGKEELLESNVDCHETKYSELTRNRLKVLSSNLGVGEQMAPCLSEEISNKNEINCSQCQFPDTTEKAPTNIVEQPSALAGYLCKEGPFELNVDCHETKYSELTRNRLKVLSSNLGVGEQMAPCLSEEISNKNGMNVLLCEFPETTEKAPDSIVEQPSALTGYLGKEEPLELNVDCHETKYSELTRNRLKVLSSNLGVIEQMATCLSEEMSNKNGMNVSLCEFPETTEKAPDNIVEQPSDLSKNRLKSLHSDFARGDEFKITIGQEEAENNKKKILGTHFVLGTELSVYNKILKANADSNIENSNLVNEKSKVVGDDTTKTNETVEDAINNSPQQVDSDNVSKENIIEEGSSFNLDLSCDIAAETSSMDKIDDQPEAAKEYSNVNWFHNCNKHAGTFTYLFKDDNQILLPEQSFDYYSLLKVVPGSLKVVLDTQVKLVNEALMEMFLKELKLLDEAAKLKKYFFLDGEFGKKLTASLCTIIEKERPSTLLTFGKLRDILSFPSQGDEKLSFIVKEIPVAFEHTNPQVLSCLGLSYRFDWPLNLIFTEIAVSKYNDVFEYILSLQRVTWQLEQVWIALKFKSQINGEEYTQIQLYRHIMSQFVCTLQWYISTTVFEHSWQKFKRDVMEVTNLQELYRKHAAYIKDIIFKCFLEERSSGLMKKIQNLLKCILIFCQVMRFGEWSISESGVYRHCNFVKLQNTFSSFLKLARYIIRQIEKLVKVNYQEGLANLYNMFTINSFYLS